MFCTNCGAKMADDLKFCTDCGKLLPAAKPASPPPAAAPAAPQAPPVAPAPVAPPAVDAPPPPPPSAQEQPVPRLEVAPAAPSPRVTSRPQPVTRTEPPTEDLAATASSGPKVLLVVVVALLVISAAAAYFHFSSSGTTQDASVPGSQPVAPVGAQAAPVGQPPAAPQPATQATDRQAGQTQAAVPETPAAVGSIPQGDLVERLVRAAAAGDATELDALIRDVESQPKPAVGNRGEARRINYRALPLLKDKRYAEAIPILEQAHVADESDVEVVGNLADTLMRAGKLDEAWRMALVGLRLAPRRTVSWSTIGMLSAKRDDLSAAAASLVVGYRFSDVQPTTLQVYSRLAAADADAKVRAAMEEAVKRIKASQ